MSRRCVFWSFGIPALLLLFFSCSGMKRTVEVTAHDTLHVFHTDSTHTTDSIFIERNTTVREADSALLAEYGIRLTYGERALFVLERELERVIKSTSNIKVDTVLRSVEKPVPYPVVEYKEKPLRWWVKVQLYALWAILAALAIYSLYIIYKPKR